MPRKIAMVIKDVGLIAELLAEGGFSCMDLDLIGVKTCCKGTIHTLNLGVQTHPQVLSFIDRYLKAKGTYKQGVQDGREQVQEDLDASQKHIVELQNKLIKIKEAMDA